MTDRPGYKMHVTLDFKMSQDERHAALRELSLRPLEYKTKHLPPGVFKVEILNAHEYDNARRKNSSPFVRRGLVSRPVESSKNAWRP